jgi:hypothetical protein
VRRERVSGNDPQSGRSARAGAISVSAPAAASQSAFLIAISTAFLGEHRIMAKILDLVAASRRFRSGQFRADFTAALATRRRCARN